MVPNVEDKCFTEFPILNFTIFRIHKYISVGIHFYPLYWKLFRKMTTVYGIGTEKDRPRHRDIPNSSIGGGGGYGVGCGGVFWKHIFLCYTISFGSQAEDQRVL